MLALNANKIKLLVLLSVVLIVISVWCFLPHNQSIAKTIEETNANHTAAGMANSASAHAMDLAENKLDSTSLSQNIAVKSEAAVSPVVQQFRTIMGTPADAEEVKNWFNDRGYTIWGATKEYDSYNEETLKKLGDTGDIRALAMLEKIYFAKHTYESSKVVQDIRVKSAMYGSTEALAVLGTAKQSEFMSLPSTDEGKIPALIESLAYLKTAQLRGDSMPYFTLGNYLLDNNGSLLSNDDQQKINIRAQEIYDDLESKRIELGLGKFDNSVPDSVKKYFDKVNPKK